MRDWACRRRAEPGYKDSNPDGPRVLEARRAPSAHPGKAGTGLEPVSPGYEPDKEPTPPPCVKVPSAGFEPATPGFEDRRSVPLSYKEKFGRPGEIRTLMPVGHSALNAARLPFRHGPMSRPGEIRTLTPRGTLGPKPSASAIPPRADEVKTAGLEPATPGIPIRCATNCATPCKSPR